MATRYGGQVYVWLLEKGWQPAPSPKEFVCGDSRVIDPMTNTEVSVYEAAKLQKERTGEYPDFLPEDH